VSIGRYWYGDWLIIRRVIRGKHARHVGVITVEDERLHSHRLARVAHLPLVRLPNKDLLADRSLTRSTNCGRVKLGRILVSISPSTKS